MRYRRTLRFRITISFLLVGVLLSALFAFAAYLTSERSEDLAFSDTLNVELRRSMSRDAAGSTPPGASGDNFQRYVSVRADRSDVPAWLAPLDPGLHDIAGSAGEVHVAVEDRLAKRYYLVAPDFAGVETFQARLYVVLAVGVLASGYGALWLGFKLSDRIIEPVSSLARQVGEIRSEGGQALLAPQFEDDEVGQLASALDDYRERIASFMDREKEFTANVSHELRTPISVIQGAVELIEGRHVDDPEIRRPLDRLKRAASYMGDLIDVLLMLAREAPPDPEHAAQTVPVEPIVREVVEDLEPAAGLHKVKVLVEASGALTVKAPRAVVGVVCRNLIENAIAGTDSGTVVVTLDCGQMRVSDTGRGISTGDRSRVFERSYRGRNTWEEGAGLGLHIVQRLCERYGWTVELDSGTDRGTSVRIGFA